MMERGITMIRKQMICLLAVLCVWASFSTLGLAAENVTVTVNDFSNPGPGVQSVANGSGMIDWHQGVVEVKGLGMVPAQYANMAQARIMARRAAIVDGYRNLAEAVQGVQVDAQSTLQNYQLADDMVRTRVSALIQGARVISERQIPDGAYEVIMVLNLYGDNSLDKVIMASPLAPQLSPIPQPTANISFPTKVTGLVVDTRGLGLEPVMAVKIYDQSGRVIYGNQYVSANYQVSYGLADYVFTDEDLQSVTSGQSRAGNAPLTLRAVGLRDNNCNVVISNEDGDKVLAANRASGFIQKCAVVLEK
jgi:hypothetical protein